MFSRGHRPTGNDGHARSDGGGLGVGLALARRLAEMHGGTLTGQSDGPGQGSVFTLRLPLAASQAAPAATPGAVHPFAGQQRILVVDDNRDSADSLSMLLSFLGADVRVARTGAEAVEMFRSYEPAVVLLDIGLPDMDGYDVARRLRGERRAQQPTIVALTGWGQDRDRERARDAGCDHHLIKPADINVLRALLARLGT
jgi:CheY-like chemotaxis protein